MTNSQGGTSTARASMTRKLAIHRVALHRKSHSPPQFVELRRFCDIQANRCWFITNRGPGHDRIGDGEHPLGRLLDPIASYLRAERRITDLHERPRLPGKLVQAKSRLRLARFDP